MKLVAKPSTHEEWEISYGLPVESEKRFVRFENIHDISSDDFDALSKSVDVKNGDVILDAGASYGSVTRELALRNMHKQAFYCVADISQIQLNLAKNELSLALGDPFTNQCIRYYRDNMTNSTFSDSSFDKIVAKMLIHERPKVEQQLMIDEVSRILKENGKLIVWDFVPHADVQILFQKMARKKDALAGFTNLVNNRYFFREEELLEMLLKAGFDNIRADKIIPFRFSTYKRLESELKGDLNKLRKWNDFVRKELAKLPAFANENIDCTDEGDNLTLVFRAGIYSCIKR